MSFRHLVTKAKSVYQREGIFYLFNHGPAYLKTWIRITLLSFIPNNIYRHYFNIFHRLSPGREMRQIVREDQHYVVTSSESERITHTPSPKKPIVLEESQMLDKYTLDGFITVQEGDTVFDVGAFVGEFSYNIVGLSDQVVAIEPEDKNINCFWKNIGKHNSQSVTLIQGVAWRKNTTLELNLSSDPTEHSISTPDFGTESETTGVDARTIDDIASELDISKIDFLKIEAEGAEMAVLEGMNDTKVDKISIDISEPNDEFSSTEIGNRIVEELNQRGYKTRKEGSRVFAKK